MIHRRSAGAEPLCPLGVVRLKEFSMRIIFVVMLASVLSILAFKYVDRSIGESDIMASPMEMSAEN
jgi:hypothetical protein|nr:hypothetical protein RKHAN_01578 [Rhizobium sp. Khangiran2]CAD6609499.1 hypothetical protein RNT25_02209 [arsenite-oxidising bacterium NT-25]